MNGELALAIALAAHGNAYLASPLESKPPELMGANSTLQYVDSIVFREVVVREAVPSTIEASRGADRGAREDMPAAGGTAEWYDKLKSTGASRLWVLKLPYTLDLPEVMATAFANSIPWAIQADYKEASVVWSPRWELSGSPDRSQPWEVYAELETSRLGAGRPPHSELRETRVALREKLEQALDFSKRANLDYFPDDFSQAVALLESDSPAIPYHPDLLPDAGYDLPARQIIAAAAKGWVFGGMMSFNDLGSFPSPALAEEYESLLVPLYETVVQAILSAANAFESR